MPQRRKEPSRKRGTEGSNPGPSSGESANPRSLALSPTTPRRPTKRCRSRQTTHLRIRPWHVCSTTDNSIRSAVMQLKSSPVVMAHDLGSFGAFIDAAGEIAEQRTIGSVASSVNCRSGASSGSANGASGGSGTTETAAERIPSDAAPGGSGAVGFRGHRGRPRIHHGADVKSAEAERARLGGGRLLCGRRSDCDLSGSGPRVLTRHGGPSKAPKALARERGRLASRAFRHAARARLVLRWLALRGAPPGNRCLPDMSYILTPAEGIRQVLVPRANGSERTPYDEREGLYCGNSCTRKSAGHCAGSSPLPVTLGQSA